MLYNLQALKTAWLRDGGIRQLHAPAALPSGKLFPVPQWTGTWACPRVGLLVMEMKNLAPAGIRTPAV
jgi:hypothetical protein